MIFTREPLIETIISPKDGYKLAIRNSKTSSSEEYLVDSIEVVSFGKALFFRSLERPKPFLVPITDYEVLEVKDTRVALKNVSHERNIKIGGGRESAFKVAKEPHFEKIDEREEVIEQAIIEPETETSLEVTAEARTDKKRDRRRHRRRRLADERKEWVEKEKADQAKTEEDLASEDKITNEEGGDFKDETMKVSSSMFSSLIPPPSTLISETISRYKEKEGLEGVFFTKTTAAQEVEESKEQKDNTDSQEENPSQGSSEAPSEPKED